MSAIMLLETREQEKRYLHEQLMAGSLLQQEILKCAERYLIDVGIYNVILIEEQHFRDYKVFLQNTGLYKKKQIVDRTAALRNIQKYWVNLEYGDLIKELERCSKGIESLVANIKRFLIRQGIHHLGEIDYEVRKKYEQELLETKTYQKTLEYLKVFDRIKQAHILQEISNFQARMKKQIKFENQIIFLPYLPNQELAAEFDKVQNKNELVWDFKQDAPEKLKRQVFTLLFYILENIKTDDPKDRRVRFLLPLQWMYEYCISEQIADIECLELEQIRKLEQIIAKKVVNVKNFMQIVDNSRKILFVSAKEIHWQANIWYMEKFHFSPGRINSSNPVQTISFMEITNQRNRELLQEYTRYLVGITELTIGNIRSQQSYIKKFLECINNKVETVCDVTEEQMDDYFKSLQDDKTQADTVNKKIIEILKFFQYLKVQGHIKDIPFEPSYYLQKTFPIHHDRSVEKEVYMEILHKLHLFPEKQRMIFLHLWCTGLRISEVCTLKGDAYYWDGKDAWIKIYQIKMKSDKMIPIPLVLYRIMLEYIKKNRIRSKEYVFKNQKGGAYRGGTFIILFKKNCKRNRIANGKYVFKSHDYRHTLATRFYDAGVSIQTIRDYLGHNSENMTKQYIDYMPKKIAKANEEYFSNPENSLASAITVKKNGEKK